MGVCVFYTIQGGSEREGDLGLIPPVSEVGFTVQFDPLEGLTFVDLAELYELYKPRLPIIQQVPPLPTMQLTPGEEQFAGAPFIVPVALPRAWFVADDSVELVQFQSDRISYNWRRLNPNETTAEYPGYDALKQRLKSEKGVLDAWIERRGWSIRRNSVGELLYTNTIPLMVDGEPRRISDVLSFYKPINKRLIQHFQMAWVVGLDSAPGAVTVTAAVSHTPDGILALVIQMAARFALDDVDCFERFDEAHLKIHEIFADTVTDSVRGVAA